ncbi:hypothetical protein MPH_09603 [Macrophomina phaseolina MS6]|uniref:Uncharacterized protein n=1 Tax=Macrophomina phaseolina (strain MS6) TaxID=1126212 RepID=K2QU70_MACPH|nr:hypothetical protein MPH_09603 [Macrophomina phaseolina MS6]
MLILILLSLKFAMQGHDYSMPIPFPRAFRTSPPPTELKMFGELPEEIPTSVKSEPDSQGEPLIPTQNSTPAPYSIDSTPPRLELRMRNLQSPFLSSPSETSDGFSQKRSMRGQSKQGFQTVLLTLPFRFHLYVSWRGSYQKQRSVKVRS